MSPAAPPACWPTIAESAGTRPWKPRKSSSVAESLQAEDSDRVISQHELLVRRVSSLCNKGQPDRYGLRTELSVIVSPMIRPAPPPGLELPELAPLASVEPVAPEAERQPASDLPPPKPEEYKVLLQNLPEAMVKECMLRVMLEQANLTDIMHLAFRPNGKALLTFSTYASARHCIKHFHGRTWGSSKAPVSAMYVTTVKSTKTSAENNAPQQEAAAKPLSADAFVFVPASKQRTSSSFSIDAPVFVPASDKMCGARDRFFSDASTNVGDSASDGCMSATEEEVACA